MPQLARFTFPIFLSRLCVSFFLFQRIWRSTRRICAVVVPSINTPCRSLHSCQMWRHCGPSQDIPSNWPTVSTISYLRFTCVEENQYLSYKTLRKSSSGSTGGLPLKTSAVKVSAVKVSAGIKAALFRTWHCCVVLRDNSASHWRKCLSYRQYLLSTGMPATNSGIHSLVKPIQIIPHETMGVLQIPSNSPACCGVISALALLQLLSEKY